jgi:hypothetical protein
MILLIYLKYKVKILIHATKIYNSIFTFSNKKVKKVEKTAIQVLVPSLSGIRLIFRFIDIIHFIERIIYFESILTRYFCMLYFINLKKHLLKNKLLI